MDDSVAGTNRNGHAGGHDRDRSASIAAVVLAAGAGRRLRPLTELYPKALCPVANRPLVDHALERAAAVTSALAVNLHHGRELLESHLSTDVLVYLSVEQPQALGTAGALAGLRAWIAGRGVLVQNADAWSTADLAPFTDGWDGERIRLLITPGADGRVAFGPGVGLVASLLPWSEVSRLHAVPSGLYEMMWRRADAEGRIDVVGHRGSFVDCGTPRQYLRANLEAAALLPGVNGTGSLIDPTAVTSAPINQSVIGPGATVAGTVKGSVVWGGSQVAEGETLVDSVRAGNLTVVVR